MRLGLAAQGDELIRVEQYSDMSLRPRFVSELDPAIHKLKEILAEYHLPYEVECGLANCRRRHFHGLLVVTEDGTETNIGCDCGAREFPDQFDVIRKSFNILRARIAHMDVIADYLQRAGHYDELIDGIWYEEHGGEWADRCHKLYRDMCPDRIQQQILNAARNGSWALTVQRSLTFKEREEAADAARLGYKSEQSYIERTVGVLRGGPALAQRVAYLLKPLRDKMRAYEGVDPHQMTSPARREWAEWSRAIPHRIEEARKLVLAARELYGPENLKQLVQLARDNNERRAISQFIGAVQAAGSKARKAG